MWESLHKKRVISFSIVAVALISLAIFEKLREAVLISIRDSLNWEPLYYIIVILSLLIGLYYTFYFSRYSKTKELRFLFKVFGPLFDPPANTLTFGIVISSVLRLVKGLFNQYFFDIEYFKEFDIINVSAISLACIPLLIWSVNGLVQFFKVIFVKGGEEIGEVIAKNNDEMNSDN